MVFQNDILAGASGSIPTYQIDQSIRFNDDDTASLYKTFASTGDRRTWTLSLWFKRGNLTRGAIFSAGTSNSNIIRLQLQSADVLNAGDLVVPTDFLSWNSDAVYRDPSAWYHVVFRWDTTQATAADRFRVYINGIQQTPDPDIIPAQNYEGRVNQAVKHEFGRSSMGTDYIYDGYMAEINFIDGQALAPTDFGEFNTSGVWVPKEYTGSYGTNGFYITGADSADLGADYSGNNNDFTSSGLTSDDQVSDSPTLNFPVISPIDYQTGSNVTISNGNLTFQNANSGSANDARATFAVSSGKWYWEVEADSLGQSGVGREFIGVVSPKWYLGAGSAGSNFSQDSTGYAYNTVGQKINNGSAASYGSSLSAGDIVGVALDLDNGKIWWSVNGTFQASGDPAAGTNEAYSGLSGTFAPAFAVDYGVATSRLIANFGQTGGLTYTPPTGFSQVNSSTLPTPTIADGSLHFNPYLYTGDGSASTRSFTGMGFQPDFIWKKKRSGADHHWLHDAVRGATKGLNSNRVDTEYTSNRLTSFDSDGFSFATSDPDTNGSGATYVAWAWKGGNSSGSSNEDGATSSTVSANQTAGFSAVTYTGTGSATTIGHGLGAVPQFIAIKGRTGSADSWGVYPGTSMGYGGQYRLKLNETSFVAASAVYWNNTDATSSVFTVTAGSGQVGESGVNYVAYCWAEVEGFSKFGSYTGNGSADGPFLWCGFRPAWIMIKRTSAASAWTIFDNQRDGYNVDNNELVANTNAAETTTDYVDILSNGFKLRSTDADLNAANGDYVFMAFAEHPFGGDGVAPATAR